MKYKRLKRFLVTKKINFSENEKLAGHTSVNVGGEARFFVEIDSEKKFVALLNYLKEAKIRSYILGNGTNTLACDKRYNGLVICTKKLRHTKINNNGIYTQCGLGIFEFCNILKNNSLSGLEFLYGIPGTIGGAIVMNAGAFNGEISKHVEYVKVYSDGRVKKISKDKLKFGYRSSVFQNSNMIVLGAKFSLNSGDKNKISNLQKEYFNKKLNSQPYDYASFGSAFKKYNGEAISKLIDSLGLKGYKVGGVQISTKHAGFLINLGNATCKDYRKMIKYIQMRVKGAYGIIPELEVKFLE